MCSCAAYPPPLCEGSANEAWAYSQVYCSRKQEELQLMHPPLRKPRSGRGRKSCVRLKLHVISHVSDNSQISRRKWSSRIECSNRLCMDDSHCAVLFTVGLLHGKVINGANHTLGFAGNSWIFKWSSPCMVFKYQIIVPSLSKGMFFLFWFQNVVVWLYKNFFPWTTFF